MFTKTITILFCLYSIIMFTGLHIHKCSPDTEHNHVVISIQRPDIAVAYAEGDVCYWIGHKCYQNGREISTFNYQNQ